MTDEKNIANFIFELGVLRRISRQGWKLIGINNPECVATHSLRAAQIGFILAKMENYDYPEEICSMLVFHDIGECRIGDLHKVAKRYVEADEKKAVKQQLDKLDDIGNEIFSLWSEVESLDSKAGIIAKDADLLEMAATALEYKHMGYIQAEDWLIKTERRLKTKSAIKLLNQFKQMDPFSWWHGLKKI
jgi:putative hydrolase of HD superfamily